VIIRKENILKIDGSVTGMESERSFSAVNHSARSLRKTEIAGGSMAGGVYYGGSFLDTLLGKYSPPGKEETEQSDAENGTSVSFDDMIGNLSVGRYNSVNVPMRSYSPGNAYVEKMSALYIFSILFRDFRERIREMMAGCREGYDRMQTTVPAGPVQAPATDRISGREKTVKVDMVGTEHSFESEDTKFSARGKAVCRDGREIDFNISVGMSRKFESFAGELLPEAGLVCVDPLVINLGDDVTSVSDQKFYFDLDGDGEKEYISSLAGDNGFLALDRNGDGEINDGTELFGAGTGNGFNELSAFDSDGDGWIDEDDDIFDKLKVWVMDQDGDRLISLKEAGVGAIGLMNAETEFSLKNDRNRTNAIVRSTGMFLYEDGRAGTLQQIDLVS